MAKSKETQVAEPVTAREGMSGQTVNPGTTMVPFANNAAVPVVPTTAVGFVANDAARGAYLTFPNERTGSASGSGKWLQLKMQYPDLMPFEPCIEVPTPIGTDLIRFSKGMRFECYWYGGFHGWAIFNNKTGTVERGWIHEPENARAQQIKEYSEGVLLINVNGTLMPVRASFRDALCRIGNAGVLALQGVTDNLEEWVKARPHFAPVVKVPVPQFRFKIGVQITTPNSRSTGFPYANAVVQVLPTNEADWALASATLKSEKYQAEITAVMRSYTTRLQEFQSKLTN